MKMITTEFAIGQHFLSALINGDYSGLNDKECAQLDDWVAEVQPKGSGHWSTTEITDEFARCDVTGLHGEVEQVHYVQFT
jgi:hypothetical protein